MLGESDRADDLKHIKQAIDDYVFRSAVPILAEPRNGGPAVLHGTGHFISWKEKWYLVSAEHVLSAAIDAGNSHFVGVPRSREHGELLCLEGRISRTPKIHDVAVFALSEKVVADLADGWQALGPTDIAPYRTDYDAFYFAGFPSCATRTGTEVIAGTPLGIRVGPYRGTELPVQEHYQDETDLLLEMPPLPSAISSLEGMSGAGIWTLPAIGPQDAVWTPAHEVKLVGVQTSQRRNEYIQVKQWRLAYRIFEQLDPELAAEIRSSLEPGGPSSEVRRT